MKLLQQLLETSKRKEASPRINNFVAKHAQQKTGAGQHEDKTGKKASRQRQKRAWKRELY